MIQKEKIFFFGTPQFSADILEKIINAGIKIDGVVTRPDRPKGRGNKAGLSEVKTMAQKQRLPVYQPTNKADLEKTVQNIKPDLVLVAAYGMILPESVFDGPKYKALNVHPSLLPLYRGPSPIVGVILSGDKKTGVTIMKISAGMDEGDILSQKVIKLQGNETAPYLEKKLASISAQMLIDLIPKWLSGQIKPVKQEHQNATYTKLIRKEDGKIDWGKKDAENIERMSRAYEPWPGVFTYFKNKKIDFFGISAIDGSFNPGKIYLADGRFIIGTHNGGITADKIRVEGKNIITITEFIRGYPSFLNQTLK